MIKDYPKRKPQRLKEYDYSQQGAYFFTFATQNRECLFGEIINNEMTLNELGKIVQSTWEDLLLHYSNLQLDSFIVMPNHVHGVLFLEREGFKPSPTHGVKEIIRALKTFSSRAINQYRQTQSVPVWQRGYHDHIIRNEMDLNRIRLYIVNNPLQWSVDEENPYKQC